MIKMETESTPPREEIITRARSWIKSLRNIIMVSFVSTGIHVVGTYLSWTSTGMTFLRLSKIIDNDQQGSWVGSLLPLGAVLGTLPIGILADKYGRKFTSWASMIPLFHCWFVICKVVDKAWIYVARFIAGIGCGAASVVIPIYMYEITDDKHQADLERAIHTLLNFGIYYSYIVDKRDPFQVPNVLWLALAAFYPLSLTLLLPESPKWLEAQGRGKSAERAIKKLTGKDVKLDPGKPPIMMNDSGLRIAALKLISNKRDVVMVLSLIVLQQLSGIGAITFYMKDSLDLIVHKTLSPWISVPIILVPPLVSYFGIKLVKHMEKRQLLVVSTSAMAVSFLLLACCTYFTRLTKLDRIDYATVCIILLLTYLIGFHIGFGPIPWIMIGKMFPRRPRRVIYNLALTCSWLMLFITTKIFQDMLYYAEIYVVLFIYGLFNLLGTIFVFFAVPKSINDEILADSRVSRDSRGSRDSRDSNEVQT